jgi:hypothetical protein
MPGQLPGYTYLGDYVMKFGEMTSSRIYSLYRKNADGTLYMGGEGDAPWQTSLTLLPGKTLADFQKF